MPGNDVLQCDWTLSHFAPSATVPTVARMNLRAPSHLRNPEPRWSEAEPRFRLAEEEYNSEVNKIRWMIEQVISHFKNWTIMHTDSRRSLKTFETTISAVVGLHFYRTA